MRIRVCVIGPYSVGWYVFISEPFYLRDTLNRAQINHSWRLQDGARLQKLPEDYLSNSIHHIW